MFGSIYKADVEKMEKNKLTPFNWVTIILKKTITPELRELIETTQYDQFMINRCLGGYEQYNSTVSTLNSVKISNTMHFDTLYNIIPYSKYSYLKYRFKKGKPDARIEAIKYEFKVSTKVAKIYMRIIDKDELNKLVDNFVRYMKATKQSSKLKEMTGLKNEKKKTSRKNK